jgi:SOS response regulatory protein OraA/RecX
VRSPISSSGATSTRRATRSSTLPIAPIVARALSEGLIDAALDEYAQAHGDWSRLAREVRIRRFGLAAPGDWAQKTKQARFLQYRGFSTDHIRSALGRDALGEAD